MLICWGCHYPIWVFEPSDDQRAGLPIKRFHVRCRESYEVGLKAGKDSEREKKEAKEES